MSQRRALHPGTIREEDTWCWNRAWEGPQWGLRDPHCGSLSTNARARGRSGEGGGSEGRPHLLKPQSQEDRLSPCVMVGHRPQTQRAPEEEQACLTDGSRKPVQEGGQGSHGGQGQEAQRRWAPGQTLGCRLSARHCRQAPRGEWNLHSRLQGVGGVPPPERGELCFRRGRRAHCADSPLSGSSKPGGAPSPPPGRRCGPDPLEAHVLCSPWTSAGSHLARRKPGLALNAFLG